MYVLIEIIMENVFINCLPFNWDDSKWVYV